MTRIRRRALVVPVLLLAALAFAAPAAAQEIAGSWESRVWRNRDGDERVQLSLEVDRGARGWQNGFSVFAEDLAGVSVEQLDARSGEVRFTIEREAGTLAFDGEIRNGKGVGFFAFEPDPVYRSAMASLGYDGLSVRDQYAHALFDITTEFVRELRQLGYERLPEDDLRRFAIHGVRPEFIRAMNSLGYANIDPEDLVRMRIHGVTPEWVREIGAALAGR